MKRPELGQVAMRELAERNGVADREWIASLLDRAIEVGRNEMKGRVARTLGPFVAETATRPDDWAELLDMECHMFIRYERGVAV